MRFFDYDHLHDDTLRAMSAMFADVAFRLLDLLDDDPELVKGLDKLREAKDRAVALTAVNGIRSRR